MLFVGPGETVVGHVTDPDLKISLHPACVPLTCQVVAPYVHRGHDLSGVGVAWHTRAALTNVGRAPATAEDKARTVDTIENSPPPAMRMRPWHRRPRLPVTVASVAALAVFGGWLSQDIRPTPTKTINLPAEVTPQPTATPPPTPTAAPPTAPPTPSPTRTPRAATSTRSATTKPHTSAPGPPPEVLVQMTVNNSVTNPVGRRQVTVMTMIFNADRTHQTTVRVSWRSGGVEVATQTRTFTGSGTFNATFEYEFTKCGHLTARADVPSDTNAMLGYPQEAELIGWICNG
jgi:hypothetical protein